MLCDFFFYSCERLRDFFCVPTGCMILLCVERLRDFFSCPKRMREFFCAKRLHDFLCAGRLRDFFLYREVV